MIDDQQSPRLRSAMQLAEQGVRRPRRAPQPPAIDPADLPDPDELARLRAQLAPRRRPWHHLRPVRR